MKKIVSLILCLAMLSSLFVGVAFAAENETLQNAATDWSEKAGYVYNDADSVVLGYNPDLTAPLAAATYKINVATAGTYNLTINYQKRYGSDHQVGLSVNGGATAEINVAKCEDEFKNANLGAVTLAAGENTITLTNLSDKNFLVKSLSLTLIEAAPETPDEPETPAQPIQIAGTDVVEKAGAVDIDNASGSVIIRYNADPAAPLAAVTYKVTVAAAGTYNLTINYQKRYGGDHQVGLAVNGGATAEINVAKCEDEFKNANLGEVKLIAGENTITLTNLSDKDFYIKSLTLTPVTVEPHVHNYEAAVTAPTCTTAGYTTYTCACGDTYVADEVAATGHSYNAVVTAPTCAAAGYTTYTCACGDTYIADHTAATGEHTYDNDQDADCNVCGATREVGPAKAEDLIFAQNPSLSFQDYIGVQVMIESTLRDQYDEIYLEVVQIDPEKGAITTNYEGFLFFYDLYVVYDHPVLSWAMAEQITLTLYGVKDGVTYVGDTFTGSVESMALSMLVTYANRPDICAIMVDLLNYGAAVQTQFKHNETKLPNTQLEAYAHLGTQTIPELKAEVANTGAGVQADVVGISLQAKVTFEMLFSVDISAYEVKATLNGTEVAVSVDAETYGAYGWTIVALSASAGNLRDVYELALYDANGEVVSVVYNLCAESLTKSMLGGEYNDVVVAMMRYGDAVAAVFG